MSAAYADNDVVNPDMDVDNVIVGNADNDDTILTSNDGE